MKLKIYHKVRENAIHITVNETRASNTEQVDLLLKQIGLNEWKFEFGGVINRYDLNYIELNEFGKFGDFKIVEHIDGRTEIWFEIINTSLDNAIYLGREDFTLNLVTDKGNYKEKAEFNTLPNILETFKTITPNSQPFYSQVSFHDLEGEFEYFIFENVELIDKNNRRVLMEEIRVTFPDELSEGKET